MSRGCRRLQRRCKTQICNLSPRCPDLAPVTRSQMGTVMVEGRAKLIARQRRTGDRHMWETSTMFANAQAMMTQSKANSAPHTKTAQQLPLPLWPSACSAVDPAPCPNCHARRSMGSDRCAERAPDSGLHGERRPPASWGCMFPASLSRGRRRTGEAARGTALARSVQGADWPRLAARDSRSARVRVARPAASRGRPGQRFVGLLEDQTRNAEYGTRRPSQSALGVGRRRGGRARTHG